MTSQTRVVDYFCVVVAATCLAQDFCGNPGGTVLDSSGAVVPGVEVKAVNVDEAGKCTILRSHPPIGQAMARTGMRFNIVVTRIRRADAGRRSSEPSPQP